MPYKFQNLHGITIIHKLIRIIVFVTFLFPVCVYFNRILNGGNIWQTGDWLINFNGGFVRRGLIGSLFVPMAEVFNISPIIFAGITQILIYSYVILNIFFLMKNIDPFIGLLIISPIGLLFFLNDPDGTFRKELLVFSALIFFLKNFHFYKYSKLILNLIFVVLLFSWETVVFFWPLVLFLMYAFAYFNFKELLVLFSFFMAISFLYIYIIYRNIQNIKVEKICNFLDLKNVKNFCTGAINWSAASPGDALTQTLSGNNSFWILFFSFLLIFFCFLLILFVPVPLKNKIIFAIIPSLISWFPIFIITPDFGRSINTFFLIIIIFIILNSDKIHESKNYRFSILFVILISNFCWGVPHWVGLLENPNNLNFLDFSSISKLYNWLAVSII